MSYNTLAALAIDGDLRDRIAACAATQGIDSPLQWADSRLWSFASAPGWDAAYAYAIASNIPRPGHDEGVITDAMILAAVQPLVSPASSTPAGP